MSTISGNTGCFVPQPARRRKTRKKSLLVLVVVSGLDVVTRHLGQARRAASGAGRLTDAWRGDEITTRPRKYGKVATAATVVVVLFAAAVAVWELSGGSLLTMETPSMCPSLCVGSLLVEEPVHGQVHVGELVSFHPPGASGETYTHEISKIFPNGMIQTRGIAVGKHDPWLIAKKSITGQVKFSVWGLGWLFQILPFLAGGITIWVLTWLFISDRYRRALNRIWMAALVALPLWILRPLIRGSILSSGPYGTHRGWVQERLVNTGLMPVVFRAAGGQVASHVRSTTVLHIAGPVNHHNMLLTYEAVSLYWWGWAIIVLICASPLLAYFWHVWRNNETTPVEAWHDADSVVAFASR